MYKYIDPFGKKCYLYSGDLGELREKEDRIKRDQLDGLDIYMMGKATVNFVFDRYIRFKTELRKTTYSNYIYTYDHYVRKGFGERKIAEIKYSDVLQFYTYLLEEEELSILLEIFSCQKSLDFSQINKNEKWAMSLIGYLVSFSECSELSESWVGSQNEIHCCKCLGLVFKQ